MSIDLIRKLEELEARVAKLESAPAVQEGGATSTTSKKDRVSVGWWRSQRIFSYGSD